MDDLDLARTLQVRLDEDPELATTLVREPRRTIVPGRAAPAAAVAALAELRALGASMEGRFTVHHPIGEGGMGIVHLATQATVGRPVAVKTLREGGGDEAATLRILREAWVTGALEHPNIVPVYDVGVDADGAPVIVMKRIEGRTWAELLHAPAELARRFSAFDALEWNLRTLASVCNAVDFAHSRGILHRDLKPENVMVGAFGEVTVLDWGLAVSVRADPGGRFPLAVEATDIAGTPCYMAPEMLLGGGAALSPRTDVYLLGAIFYEICAGAPPHEGATVEAMLSSVLLSAPRFPQSFPAEAQGICQRAMSRDPAGRYESAGALRAAIEGYLRHRGSRKLAWEAKRSLTRLLHAIEHEPPGEDRTLAVFNLLGECRFGYRAALAAWPDNEAARRDLDRALLAVIEHELAGGDPLAAAPLLREVSATPPDLPARVEAATRARAEQDERLRRLELDHDPRVGTRTRTFIGAIYGVSWTLIPALGWVYAPRGSAPSHQTQAAISAGLLALGLLLFAWARETLTKTQFNRRIAATLGLQLALQILLVAGASLAGLSPAHGLWLLVFSWSLTMTMLAVWVERWFAVPAATSALAFLVAAARPELVYAAMTLENLVFTAVLVRFWFPRDTLAKMKERRDALRRRARRWLEDAYGGEGPAGDGEA
jgi:serine/threonine-protein kinase